VRLLSETYLETAVGIGRRSASAGECRELTMAAAGGGGGGDNQGDDQFDPPRTPHLVLKEDATAGGDLSPDTEENVTSQTDGVFRHFVYQLSVIDRADTQDADDTPTVPELSPFGESPLS